MGDTDAASLAGFRRESLTVRSIRTITIGHTHSRLVGRNPCGISRQENMVPAARPMGIAVADSVKPSRNTIRLICRPVMPIVRNCPYSLMELTMAM